MLSPCSIVLRSSAHLTHFHKVLAALELLARSVDRADLSSMHLLQPPKGWDQRRGPPSLAFLSVTSGWGTWAMAHISQVSLWECSPSYCGVLELEFRCKPWRTAALSNWSSHQPFLLLSALPNFCPTNLRFSTSLPLSPNVEPWLIYFSFPLAPLFPPQ